MTDASRHSRQVLRIGRRAAAAFGLLVATAIAGCSGGGGDSCGGIVEPIRVVSLAPTSITIDAGTNAQATASISGGCANDDRSVRWSSSDPAVATVDASGKVTGVAGGSATITASAFSDQARSTISVTVRARTATTLDVRPEVDTLSPLGTLTLTATVRDQTGAIFTGATIAYRSLSPSLATVSSAGVVSAVAAGTASIEAAIARVGTDSLRDTVRVMIVPACSLIRPIQIGTTISGRIDASSCQNLYGYRAANQYTVTVNEQSYYSVRLVPTLSTALVPLNIGAALHGLPVADTAVTGLVVIRAGTFGLLAAAPAQTANNYTLATQLDPDSRVLCVPTDATLGVSFRTAITPTCAARDVRLLPALTGNQTLRVTGSAPGFAVTLELRNAASGALLQRAVASGAGAQASITYVNLIQSSLVRVRVIGTSNANDLVTLTIAQ